MRITRRAASAALTLSLLALSWPAQSQPAPSLTQDQVRAALTRVDADFIRQDSATGRDWPSYGLNFSETRFSPLTGITAENAARLGLAWSYDLGSRRGVQATPVVVGGVMYVTASWSVVHALDARTGARLWSFDPQVPREYGARGCCDVVNRGVAVHRGKV